MLRWRREGRREGKRVVSLQLAWAPEPINCVREINEPCINSKDVTAI
jgi:hypothetical protein